MGSEGSHESRIARGAGFLLLATVLSTGVGFVVRTFLIRRLPTADYGLFALALAVGGILTTVGTLGLRQGLARAVSRCETESEVRNLTLTAISSTVIVSLAFSGTLVAFADPLAVHVFQEDGLAPYLQVIGALVPGMSIQAVVIATFRGRKRVYERVVVRNLVSPIARLALIVAAVVLGYGAFGAIVAWTIGIGLSTTLGIYYLHRRTTILRVAPFDPRYRPLLAFSLPLMVSSATWTAVQQADTLLLGYYSTSSVVGIYDGAFLLASLLLMVLGSFGFLFMPVFSELEADGDLERMHDVYTSVTEWAALLVLPVYLAMIFVPDAILTTVFKDAYAEATVPLALIASGFFAHVLSGSCGDALIALGRTRLVLAGNAGAGVLNVLLNLVLIPRFGITGAAAASAGTYALFNLFYLFWLNRETDILPFSRSFLTPLLGSTVVAGGIWAVADTVVQFGVISLASVLAITYLLHTFVVVRTKETTRGDERLLSKIESNIGFDVRNAIERLR